MSLSTRTLLFFGRARIPPGSLAAPDGGSFLRRFFFFFFCCCCLPTSTSLTVDGPSRYRFKYSAFDAMTGLTLR